MVAIVAEMYDARSEQGSQYLCGSRARITTLYIYHLAWLNRDIHRFYSLKV